MYYNKSKVGPATDNYRLSILGFTGITPTDPFYDDHPINGQQFSTYDKDNDAGNPNCALNGHGNETGGWWHKNCFHISLNFKYGGPWGFMIPAGTWYSPPFIEMKVHPSNCKIH